MTVPAANRRRLTLSTLATVTALWLIAVPAANAAIPPGAVTDNLIPNANAYGCVDSTQANSTHVCQTDNSDVSWWIDDHDIDDTTSPNDTPAETNINKTMANSYDGTDLHTYYDTTPKTTGAGETDVVYVSNPGGFGNHDDLIGFTWCDDAITGSNYACDQQYVNFRSPNATRALACHETGHAVGLTHGEDADPVLPNQDARLNCMVKKVNNNLQYIDDNNVANINFVY